MARSKNAIIADGVRILRALRAVGDDRDRRTVLLRDVATNAVELREHFVTRDGKVDWVGRTWAYRELQRQMYADAGFEPVEARTTQAAARYHIGNIIRERLTPTELEEAGIQDASPYDRVKAGREQRAALVRSVQGTDDTVAALTAALTLLNNVQPDRVPAEERAEAAAVVAEVAARVKALTAGLRPRRRSTK